MPENEAAIRAIIRAEFERIGIYADDAPGLAKTRANFVGLDEVAPHADALVEIAPHADALIDLVREAERRREAAEDEARAATEDRRERRNKRYEAFVGFLASIAQYGAAGALGYGVSWFLAHWRH